MDWQKHQVPLPNNTKQSRWSSSTLIMCPGVLYSVMIVLMNQFPDHGDDLYEGYKALLHATHG